MDLIIFKTRETWVHSVYIGHPPHNTAPWAQLHSHTHNNHKWHIQWHTTRLATHHKMANTCNNMASITVNSRPLKKPWQCIHQMPHVRVSWAVLEAQLYTGVYSLDTNGCYSQFTSSICTCAYTLHEISTKYLLCESVVSLKDNHALDRVCSWVQNGCHSLLICNILHTPYTQYRKVCYSQKQIGFRSNMTCTFKKNDKLEIGNVCAKGADK